MSVNRSAAVMAQRAEPADSLDFFPTPPWATRALLERLPAASRGQSVREPACGQGHMVDVLRDHFAEVYASDVHDYSRGQDHVGDYLLDWDLPAGAGPWDWIVTNPPFRLAEGFAVKARRDARHGVALLVRTQFLEGGGRAARLFRPDPPSLILQFAERVSMFRGRLVRPEDGSKATAYCWVVWERTKAGATGFDWIDGGTRARLRRPDDYKAANSE